MIKSYPETLNRLQRAALIAIAVGALLSLISVLQGVDRFLHSYLFAYCYWTGMALGCLGILTLPYLAERPLGRADPAALLEAGALTLPLMLLLFCPVALTTPRIYTWARPEALSDSAIQKKAMYLNTGFFVARTIVYFLLWTVLAALLRFGSLREDRKADRARDSLNAVSATGIIVYVLTASFAAMDWTMSLEPDWYSSIYGLILIAGQALLGMSLCILLMRLLRNDEKFPRTKLMTPRRLRRFCKHAVAFSPGCSSACVSFSQFLIIWSGNLPDEAVWYLRRSRGGWQWVVAVLAAFHFLVHALLLLRSKAATR